MPLQLPPPVNYNTNIAPPANPVDQAGKIASLQQMMSEQALRKQLAPLQVQEAQARVQQEQQANQIQQTEMNSQKALMAAFSDPTIVSGFTGGDAASGASGPGVDLNGLTKQLIQKGVSPKDAMATTNSLLERSKTLATMTKDQVDNYGKSHDLLAQVLAPITSIQDPQQAAAALATAKQKLAAAPIPGLDANDLKVVQNASIEQLPSLVNALGLAGKMADYHKQEADVTTAQATADIKKMDAAESGSPLVKMANDPTMFAGEKLPASIAYLQGKVKDPDAATAAQATRLLGQAKTSEAVQLSIEKQKKAAEQAIADGDPAAAAKLLVDGTVAPSQLISSRKPEFAQKAFTMAAQSQPGWDARTAEADFKVASSPANVGFFGSAKSLTDKGGTLDQLAAAGKDIPQNQIPVFNTVADAIKASTGSGPVAKYASVALGVADDYAKVMGGGQGSDSSREQALKLISAKQSPEQRKASIEGIRGAVNSQATSRVGSNGVLKKMYGEEEAESGKSKPAANLQYATDQNGVLHSATAGLALPPGWKPAKGPGQ